MSAAVSMYALKPIINTNDRINPDCCVYRMKNIHGSSRINDDDHACKRCNPVTDISEQVINFLKKPLPEVQVLEARQEKILAQLAELKQQVLDLCTVLKWSEAPEPNPTPTEFDLLINVNPQKHCYAIQALSKLWHYVDFRVTTYKHSSVLEDVPKIHLQEKKEIRDIVNLTLIWKKVEDLEVVLSGVHGYPLVGETNLLRYLSRKLPNKDYERSMTDKQRNRMNEILDLAHRLNYEETPKEIQSTLAILGEMLQNNHKSLLENNMAKSSEKNIWFYNPQCPGMVDIAVWSAIKKNSISKLPASLGFWFEQCEKKFFM